MTNDEREKQRMRLIAKAWSDESFKRRLIADPAGTLKAEKVDVPAGLEVRVVENTDRVFYFVLPAQPGALSDEALDVVAGGATTRGGAGVSDADARAPELTSLITGREGC
jgi:hypothetical protein